LWHRAFKNSRYTEGYAGEFLKTFFYESNYVAGKLKEYAVEEVRLENLAEMMPGNDSFYFNYMVFGGGGLQTPGIHDRGNE
jgi:hypothetical protein